MVIFKEFWRTLNHFKAFSGNFFWEKNDMPKSGAIEKILRNSAIYDEIQN